MPRRNRVLPDSAIVAHPGRGLFMGNRGCLHDADGALVRRWQGRRWISCLTDFRGRRRALMQPGRYTELFFLDEAVALAAGHRPCAECRRDDHLRFRAAWDRAGLPGGASVDGIDRLLHAARLAPARPRLPPGDLPPGAFVALHGAFFLVIASGLRRYDPGGYRGHYSGGSGEVTVLTPAPMLAVLRAGYGPRLHPSAACAAPMSESDKPEA